MIFLRLVHPGDRISWLYDNELRLEVHAQIVVVANNLDDVLFRTFRLGGQAGERRRCHEGSGDTGVFHDFHMTRFLIKADRSI